MVKRKPIDTPTPRWKAILDRLASAPFTLFNVLLAMGLVAGGTLAQVHMGTFEAQKEFFNSAWIWLSVGSVKLPVFPGGLTVGLLWLINLTASFITRFRLTRKDLGIFVSHAGLIFLLAGQGMTQWLSRESQLPLMIGESRNYSESARATELALIKTSDPDFDTVTSVPDSFLAREGEIHPPRLPFYLIVRRFFRNAQLSMAGSDVMPLANQGIGTRVSIQEIPPTTDDEPNNVSAYVEVRTATQSLGIWLVSVGLGAPQSFDIDGATYRLTLRPLRHYYPFTLTLKDFQHDIYPGTDIPRNFSSLVQLTNPSRNDSREALIYMNHPLRYEGKTFYQSSFGEGDKLSVLQVVENPVAVTPYFACALVVIGLLIQFLSHLMKFARKRA